MAARHKPAKATLNDPAVAPHFHNWIWVIRNLIHVLAFPCMTFPKRHSHHYSCVLVCKRMKRLRPKKVTNKRISANKTSMHHRTSKDRFWPFYLLLEPCPKNEKTLSKFVCWFSRFLPAFLWTDPRSEIREQYFFVCLSRRSPNNRILIILTFSVFCVQRKEKDKHQDCWKRLYWFWGGKLSRITSVLSCVTVWDLWMILYSLQTNICRELS